MRYLASDIVAQSRLPEDRHLNGGETVVDGTLL